MSCSMTVPAVRDRTKTVTRRHVDTWKDLKPGDRLTLIEKGMGLPKGARQVVLAEVEVINVRVEAICEVLYEQDDYGNLTGPALEGLPEMTPREFMIFWLRGHGYGRQLDGGVAMANTPCRRIEWRYLAEVH